MKTILPELINSKEEVEKFIFELWNNDEFFHLDDNASDIINDVTKEPLFTSEEAIKVNALIEQSFKICDVWELPVIENILEHIIQ